MSAGYVVTAPLVQALIDKDKGIFAHFYEGGVLPANVDKDQLQQLIDTGMVEKREIANDQAADDGGWRGPKGVKIDDVLAYVGDDPAKAVDVIEQEEAGDNRRTLLEALGKIADPAAD